MGDLSKHFSRHEFACKCGCGFDTVDHQLVVALDDVRDHFQAPVTINSGCRCHTYNFQIKGSTNSQHLQGRAADIGVRDVQPSVVQAYLKTHYHGQYGIGSYGTFTHLDTRTPGPARWDG